MRVALAYRRFGRGAAVPNYCLNLARGLAATDETWAFTREIDERPPNVQVVRFPFAFRSKRVEYALNTAVNSSLLRLHRSRQGFDVVHTNDGELVGGDVVTAHSLLRVVFRRFRRTDPEYVAWMPKSPLLWAEDLIYGARRYRRILATSEKMRAALQDVYRVPARDVALVRLGVDPQVLRPNAAARTAFRRAHGIATDAPVLLHVSTDFERKGLRTILRALPRLPADLVLVVAGRERDDRFREFAAKLGVRQRLLFLGYVPALETVYPAADLFVMPTRLDFFGYPVLEAMACGVPPVVPADAGIAEVLSDGRSAFLLADAEDADELVPILQEALAGRLTTVGREARAIAERMSTARMVQETRAVYGELARR